MSIRTLFIAIGLGLVATPARAEAPPPGPVTAEATRPPAPSSPVTPSPAGGETLDGPALPWNTTPGRGISLGPEIGAWGRGFDSSLRVRVPFSTHGGVAFRGGVISGNVGGATEDALVVAGGRLDLYGQSPVYLNLIRLYGGGGPQLFRDLKGPSPHRTRWGGGGQFGFEFFLSPHQAFFLEVGGNGGGPLVQGATVLAGIHAYPF